MGDFNYRFSTLHHRRRRKDEESDAEEERDYGGGRDGGRGRKRESSSRRREKDVEKEKKKRSEDVKGKFGVKDGDFDRDSNKKNRENDRLKERDGDKNRNRDEVGEKDRNVDSDGKKIRKTNRLKERDRASEDGDWIKSHDRDVVEERYRDIDSEDGDRIQRRDVKKIKEKGRLRERDRAGEDGYRIKSRHSDVVEEKDRDIDSEDGDRFKSRDNEKIREKDRGKERDRVKGNDRDRDSEGGDRIKIRDDKRSRNRERDSVDRDQVRGRDKDKDCERKRRKRRDDWSDGEDDQGRKRRKRENERKEEERDRSRKRHVGNSNHDSVKRKEREILPDVKKETTREEDMEEEQRVLDEEMEKRRRRVQEWQELKRNKEESEREKGGESRNKWTLEGESDDDEGEGVDIADTDMNIEENDKSEVALENGMDIDSKKGEKDESLVQNGGISDMGDDEIDPLDAYMISMILPEVEKLTHNAPAAASHEMEINLKKEKASNGKTIQTVKKGVGKSLGRVFPGEESESDYEEDEEDEYSLEVEDDEEFLKRVKKTKVDKLVIVDHSKIDYSPFRKNFYIEVKEISRMSSKEVSNYRKQLELKLHGRDILNPVHTWQQIGLSTKILDRIKKLSFEKPMPVQAQALPIIMSGRDCIGVAKTGSGKTLAFILPMLRHIKDQPPLMSGDGPIGLIMAPTRELVRQIHSDIKKFIKPLGITCVPVYGGSGVAQQIGELKRGAEIVVCTPGRMIDILCTSAGKITNLQRVTYLVMDEADRMFDMGFEPQIARIVQNIRPDRQTVLFSATFPHSIETLAKKVLNKNAVQIQVGGRSVVNKDITQLVEVRHEEFRLLRLLELLGEWYEKGKILIFVRTQEKCDTLFKYLLDQGYPCLSLHGGKEQTDRESTISDFKGNVCNLLVATSVAARGLDVKDLEVVINFNVPDHYEDYVHRVGRTGRAGKKGCAITFISEDDAKYAPDLLKALQLSDQVVPDDLKALADKFITKVNQGQEQARRPYGYRGDGFKFNEAEKEAKNTEKKAQAKQFGFEDDKSDSDDEDDGVRKAVGDLSQQVVLAQAASLSAASKAMPASLMGINRGALPVSSRSVASAAVPGGDGAARAAALAAAMNLQHTLAKIQADAIMEHYEAELEINELPQNVRSEVMHKETLGPISEFTGAVITTRGQYMPPGKNAGPGDRKLYLFIEGPNEKSVKMAKAELKHALERITQGTLPIGSRQTGKYSVQ